MKFKQKTTKYINSVNSNTLPLHFRGQNNSTHVRTQAPANLQQQTKPSS